MQSTDIGSAEDVNIGASVEDDEYVDVVSHEEVPTVDVAVLLRWGDDETAQVFAGARLFTGEDIKGSTDVDDDVNGPPSSKVRVDEDDNVVDNVDRTKSVAPRFFGRSVSLGASAHQYPFPGQVAVGQHPSGWHICPAQFRPPALTHQHCTSPRSVAGHTDMPSTSRKVTVLSKLNTLLVLAFRGSCMGSILTTRAKL